MSALSVGAIAQSGNVPRIEVAPTIVAGPASQAELNIEIGPASAIPPRSFVTLRGLPPSVGLTEGHAVGPGSWAVPITALATLKAHIPAGLAGRTEIVISLMGVDGQLLAQAKSTLLIEPAGAAPVRPPARASTAKPSAGSALRLPDPADQDLIAARRLLARAEAALANGNVEVARQFLVRAADAGLAEAALRMGTTYDPAELRLLQALGVVADPALARRWYERARELGAPEASERLARLGGR